MPSAYFKTLSGNSSGSPFFLIIVKISIPLSPFLPRISITTPSGFLLSAGYFVIFTTTTSPSCAPFLSLFGIYISLEILVSSDITNPKFL